MSKPTSNPMRIIGWVISFLVALVLVGSGSMKIMHPAQFLEGWMKFGFQQGQALPIGLVEVSIALLYLVPRTTVLGCILVAAYLGGAVCTHVRIGDPAAIAPMIIGILAWAAVWLRDQRLRDLLPLTPAA